MMRSGPYTGSNRNNQIKAQEYKRTACSSGTSQIVPSIQPRWTQSHHRHYSIFWQKMSIVSNANNRFKVKHRDTNVQTGRPGPMRSFHRYNRIEGTPTIAILEYFGREWDWGYDLTTHRTLITASKSSTQAYILFVQDRRYCCIDSAKIHARRPSSL